MGNKVDGGKITVQGGDGVTEQHSPKKPKQGGGALVNTLQRSQIKGEGPLVNQPCSCRTYLRRHWMVGCQHLPPLNLPLTI
jgi:hypothetical protein